MHLFQIEKGDAPELLLAGETPDETDTGGVDDEFADDALPLGAEGEDVGLREDAGGGGDAVPVVVIVVVTVVGGVVRVGRIDCAGINLDGWGGGGDLFGSCSRK